MKKLLLIGFGVLFTACAGTYETLNKSDQSTIFFDRIVYLEGETNRPGLDSPFYLVPVAGIKDGKFYDLANEGSLEYLIKNNIGDEENKSQFSRSICGSFPVLLESDYWNVWGSGRVKVNPPPDEVSYPFSRGSPVTEFEPFLTEKFGGEILGVEELGSYDFSNDGREERIILVRGHNRSSMFIGETLSLKAGNYLYDQGLFNLTSIVQLLDLDDDQTPELIIETKAPESNALISTEVKILKWQPGYFETVFEKTGWKCY